MKYYRDCREVLEKGVACSGVYTIKPDHLPPFEVSELIGTHARIKAGSYVSKYAHAHYTSIQTGSLLRLCMRVCASLCRHHSRIVTSSNGALKYNLAMVYHARHMYMYTHAHTLL